MERFRKRYSIHWLIWIMFLLELTACFGRSDGRQESQLNGTSSLNLTSSPTVVGSTKSCRPLDSLKTKMGDRLNDSILLYEAWNWDTDSSEVWLISFKDRSRRLLHGDLHSNYVSIAFLEGSNQFLLAGCGGKVWLSDLSGILLSLVQDPSKYLSNYRPYSPMWNKLAYASGLDEGLDRQIGRLHSPTGHKVATWQEGDEALRIVDKISGKEIEILPTGDLDHVSGSWSPDGTRFAFTYYQDDQDWYSQMYVVEADGTDLRELTPRYQQAILGRPSWSPDGEHLAVTWSGTLESTHSHLLYVVTLKAYEIKSYRVKVDPLVWDQDPVIWLPDSSWIAFSTQQPGNERVQTDIQIMNLDTGELYCATQDEAIREELMDWR